MNTGQLGVGIAYPDGNTGFHPCDTDAEAWDLCHQLKAAHPQATVWVGIQAPDSSEQQEQP